MRQDTESVVHTARVVKLRKGRHHRWECLGCGRRSFLYASAAKAQEGASGHEQGLQKGSWK